MRWGGGVGEVQIQSCRNTWSKRWLRITKKILKWTLNERGTDWINQAEVCVQRRVPHTLVNLRVRWTCGRACGQFLGSADRISAHSIQLVVDFSAMFYSRIMWVHGLRNVSWSYIMYKMYFKTFFPFLQDLQSVWVNDHPNSTLLCCAHKFRDEGTLLY
jgi:hypothetical protein